MSVNFVVRNTAPNNYTRYNLNLLKLVIYNKNYLLINFYCICCEFLEHCFLNLLNFFFM